MTGLKRLPRIAAAGLFAFVATGATLISSATQAGSKTPGSFSAAPADAAVVISVGFGAPHRYYRYYDRGGAWVRFGYGFAPAPGFVRGYYLGHAPPPLRLYRPFYGRPAYFAGPYARPFPGYYGYRPHYFYGRRRFR